MDAENIKPGVSDLSTVHYRYIHKNKALPGGRLGVLPSLSLTIKGSWGVSPLAPVPHPAHETSQQNPLLNYQCGNRQIQVFLE